MTLILGIETSCDETAAAVVADGRAIYSNVVASQIDLHRQYGGVYPEMAARQHVLAIIPVVEQALAQAGVAWNDLTAIAATQGPGLAGSLLVGINAAQGIAWARVCLCWASITWRGTSTPTGSRPRAIALTRPFPC